MQGGETDALLDRAIALIAERGYDALSFAMLAKAAAMPLAQVYQVFPDKSAILDAFVRRIDLCVLDGEAADTDGTPRDRLFDLLMRRFEAMAPYRDTVRVLERELRRRPLDLLMTAPALVRAMTWTLEAANLQGQGPLARLRAPALAALYRSVVPVWLDDDDPGLSKTMAALDRRLRRLEGIAQSLRGPTRAAGTRE